MEKITQLGFGLLRLPQHNGEIDWKETQLAIDEYMKYEYFKWCRKTSKYFKKEFIEAVASYIIKRVRRKLFYGERELVL